MSTIEVKVKKVEVFPHENADRLEVVRIDGHGGFECVVTKDEFKSGDLAIFIPPDSVLPQNILEHQQKYKKISIPGGRIRAVNIRGKLSEGLCLSPSDWLDEKDIKEEHDVTKILGITKYKPTLSSDAKNIFRSSKGINIHYNNPNFHEYTDIENIKKYPNVLKEEEPVIATKKMHGTNFRCGWVQKSNYKRTLWKSVKDLLYRIWNWQKRDSVIDKDIQEFLVGSHNKIRYAKKGAELDKDLYWRAAIKYNLKDIAEKMADTLHLISYPYKEGPHDIIIYAEIIGPGIQKNYNYGLKDDIEIRVFDIKYDGIYLDWEDVKFLCIDNKLPIVEAVYNGPWKKDLVQLAEVVDKYNNQKYNREGIVVKPIKERSDSEAGRVIFKAINPKYLLDKSNSCWH